MTCPNCDDVLSVEYDFDENGDTVIIFECDCGYCYEAVKVDD